MGLLDIYYASQGQLTVNDPDLVTQYPATVTGTPNAAQNPGAPPRNFDQPYTSDTTYLATVAANLTRLQATLPITNLDVEDPGVQGGPNADITTQYPALVTGTPTSTQNPGGPVKNFRQPWLPNITYLNANPIAGLTSGELRNTLPITNFDVEDPSVQGGPNADITTQYPANVTGTPTNTQNPGGPVRNFSQPWLPNLTYIVTNPVAGPTSGELRNTLPITNLDTEDASVQGGPLADIITNYPPLVTGTPNYGQNPGAPPKRYSQNWNPRPFSGYLDSNPIKGPDSGKLFNINPNNANSLKITNLDTTEPGVDGGLPYKTLKDPTVYPPTSNHTEEVRGYFAQPGSPPTKFFQSYDANSTYFDFIKAYI